MSSVFAAQADNVYARYFVRVEFRDRVMGGVPRDPKIIEGWLRSKAGIDDTEELRQVTIRTLVEQGVEVPADATFEDIMKASEQIAATHQTNGFKRDSDGLYLESRQVKAMLKEMVNIWFAGEKAEKWGRTRKGPKGYLAERVFVNPDRIHLDREEPDGVELFIGHVTDRKSTRL